MIRVARGSGQSSSWEASDEDEGQVYGWCVDGVWMVCGWCMDGVWMVCEWCMEWLSLIHIAEPTRPY